MGCCATCPERQPDKYAVFYEVKDGSNTRPSDGTNEIDGITLKHVKKRTDSRSDNECINRSYNTHLNERNSGDVANINENETDDSIKKRTHIKSNARRTNEESGYNSGCLVRLSTEHERQLQRNYRFLLENLMVKCITPWFVQENILSPDDEIEIWKGLTERARAELFLQKLVHSKPESFKIFLEVLRSTNQEFIVSALERDVNAQEEYPEYWTTRDEANIKGRIELERPNILNQLHPDKILGFFVEREIFSIESIASMTFKSRLEKAAIVLDSVLQNLPHAFNLLLYALKQTESDQLANFLTELVSRPRNVSKLDSNSDGKHRGYSGCKSKESKVRIQIKATLCSGEDMQPLLDVENYLVKRINTEERENVRETFFKETESELKEATFGSLIIHITPCSKRSYDKLLKFCQNGSFEKLLKTLLSDEKAKHILPQGPFTVKIELFAIGVTEEGARNEVATFRDRIIDKFDTVVDEINPMNFKRVFVERRLLSEDYFHQLGRSLVQSRSASTADFVEKVLELGEDAVLAFMETIKKDGPEYLLGALEKDSTKAEDVRDNDELIATLEEENHKSTSLDAISFHDSSFHITIHDSIELHRTPPTESAKCLNTPGTVTEVGNSRKGNSDTSVTKEIFIPPPYPSRSSSGFSEVSQFSYSSEADPAMDLEGDLSS